MQHRAIILFLLIADYLVSQALAVDVFCKGQLCSNNCNNCQLCQQTVNCVLPDCYCASKSIPGGISLSDTPQFVFFTFDDSLSKKFVQDANLIGNFFRNMTLVDSKG